MIHEEEYKGCFIKIDYDETAIDPRSKDFEGLSRMICFHKKYKLGDQDHGLKSSDFNSWDELKEYIHQHNDIAEILPLYLYDHSGITISTTPFSCRWDSGQVGYIFVTKEQCVKYKIEDPQSFLTDQVKIYDYYLTGETYYWLVMDKNNIQFESCGSYYGNEQLQYMIQDAKDSIDNHLKYESL